MNYLVLLAGAGAGVLWFLYVQSAEAGRGRALPVAESITESFGSVDDWFLNYFNVGDGGDALEPLPELSGFGALNLPRGIRNNNPGNVEYNGTAWKGLADPPTDGRFCIFTDARYGIRAMARILASYQRRGVDSLPEIINTWAPPTNDNGEFENDTNAYVLSVASRSGLSPVGMVAKSDWPVLIEAMIYHENGQQPYSMATIREGVSWA